MGFLQENSTLTRSYRTGAEPLARGGEGERERGRGKKLDFAKLSWLRIPVSRDSRQPLGRIEGLVFTPDLEVETRPGERPGLPRAADGVALGDHIPQRDEDLGQVT